MKNKFLRMKKAGFLTLGFLIGLVMQIETGFAQTQANGEDNKIYTEVKSIVDRYTEHLSPEYQPTAEDLQNKTAVNFGDLLARADLLVSHNPKMAEYYLLRGEVRYYKSLTGLSMLSQSLAVSNPEYAANFSTPDIAAGIKDFSDSLTINPAAKPDDSKAADAHRFRGKLYAISAAKNYSKQSLQNALIDFSDAKKLDEYELPADDFRKAIYLMSKDGDLVGQDFARRIKADASEAPQIYLERARYLSLIVDYDKALADILRYANSPGTDKSVTGMAYSFLNKLAGDAYKKSNVATAEDYLEKAALEIQFPANQEAAFNDATQAEKLNPQSISAHIIRAKYLIGSGKVDEGKTEAYLALVQDPNNVEALCIRGLGLAIKNDLTNSLDDFNRAIELDPELAFLYNAFGNRAKIYTALGKTDSANADMQKAQQLNQKLAEIRK